MLRPRFICVVTLRIKLPIQAALARTLARVANAEILMASTLRLFFLVPVIEGPIAVCVALDVNRDDVTSTVLCFAAGTHNDLVERIPAISDSLSHAGLFGFGID